MNLGDMSKMSKLITPEQAIDLYKANAKLALDIINAAIENTTQLRRLQFEGEEQARAMGRKVARRAAEAGTPNEMMQAEPDRFAGGDGAGDALLGPDVRPHRRDAEAPVLDDGGPDDRHARASRRRAPRCR